MDDRFISVLREILSHETTATILGIMFVISIFVGAALDDRGRDLIKWILAVVLFAVFSGFAVYSYASTEFGFSRVQFSVNFVSIVFIIYSVGLATGWTAFSLGRYSYHNSPKETLKKFFIAFSRKKPE